MSGGLVNTPGYCYAISYWMAGMLLGIFLKKRFTGSRCRALQGLLFLFLFVFMILTDGKPAAFFLPNMMVCVWLIWLLLYGCFEITPIKASYYCVRAFILGEFAASLEWQIYYFAAGWREGLDRIEVHLIFMAVIYGVVFCGMYAIEKCFQKENSSLEIGVPELLAAIFIGILVFALSNISYLYTYTPFSSRFSSELFIIRTMADFGGVAILFAYHIRLVELQERYELQTFQKMLNVQYQNYTEFEKSIEVINQKYHDLKYQIELIRSEAVTKESIDSLNQMEKEIKSYEAQNKTGNKILDTILTGKSLYCQQNEIRLTAVADGTAISFMKDIDISTLFGNALDNAIESAKKVAEPQRRLIHFTVAKQKNFVRIRVENCYDEHLVFENGLPVTTKKEKEFHGFGLKSIQSTAKKYHGSVTVEAKDHWFELRILLPVPD